MHLEWNRDILKIWGGGEAEALKIWGGGEAEVLYVQLHLYRRHFDNV